MEKIVRAQDHARRAISALKAVLLPETFLDRVEFVTSGEPFNGGHGMTIRLHGQRGAGFHGFPVQQDSASATDGSLATDVGAGKASDFAQEMHQEKAGLNLGPVLNSIDFDRDVFFHTYPVNGRLVFIRKELRGGQR